MVITEISNQKKKGRYNLFVDGEFYSGIDAEGIVKAGLKVGFETSKEQLDEIIIESEKRSAFAKLIDIISRQMKTKKEIESKLIQYGYNKIAIKLAIKQAEEYGYINDKEYALLLTKAKSNKSRAEIKQALFQKGINSALIKEAVDQISEQDEKKTAGEFAYKYMKNKEVNQKTLSSLYAYLARKGFDSQTINSVLRFFKSDFEGEE